MHGEGTYGGRATLCARGAGPRELPLAGRHDVGRDSGHAGGHCGDVRVRATGEDDPGQAPEVPRPPTLTHFSSVEGVDMGVDVAERCG